jgi:glycosyltransferase involved in cell wall biosynthesis
MNILGLLHNYPPLQNAGAEWMAHEMFKFLKGKGHEITVLVPMSDLEPYDFEGVKVQKDSFKQSREFINRADIIVSHLDRAGKALNICDFYNKPFVEIIHNTNRRGILYTKKDNRRGEKFLYTIYNSLYTKEAMKYPCPGIVVHPPVDAKRYKVVKRGSKLTLINLFWRKGGLFFQHLARLMPDRDFLGVEGGYGRQEKNESIPNIEYMANTPDARKIYAKTRILLMPSYYESYGRTAIEAMVSGIPVIASPTPGLKESLGDAGIFCGEDIREWEKAIKKLDDPEEYKTASKKSVDRFKEISAGTEDELKNMEKFLFDILRA